MLSLVAKIEDYAARLLRDGIAHSPADARRRADECFAAELAALPDLNKVLPGGAGGPL